MANTFKLFSENWALDDRQKRQLLRLVDPSTNTVSALVKDYLNHFRASIPADFTGCPSFKSMCIRGLYRTLLELENSEDVDRELGVLFDWTLDKLPYVSLVLRAAPYPILRAAYHLARRKPKYHNLTTQVPELRDLDESMLACEDEIRKSENSRGTHLISIHDLRVILDREAGPKDVKNAQDTDDGVSYHRQPIPGSQLTLLGSRRPDAFAFCASDTEFEERLLRKCPLFAGFNWSNVMLTGDMVLALFLGETCQDWNAFELRIFGLDADAATAKVREIHAHWSQEVDVEIHKSPNQIVFMDNNNIDSHLENLRLHIRLQVWQGPTEALLDQYLDPSAIGFDGTRILLLPRCARAVETGYSILTTRLILGQPVLEGYRGRERHILGYSRAKPAFGIRVLSAYAKTLVLDRLEPPGLRGAGSDWARTDPRQCPADLFPNLAAYRKPNTTSEQGLKTLRRVAYLGQDGLYRSCGFPTPLNAAFDPQRTDTAQVPDPICNTGLSSFMYERRLWTTLDSLSLSRRKTGGDVNEEESREYDFVVHLDELLDLQPDSDLTVAPLETFARICEAGSSACEVDVGFWKPLQYRQDAPWALSHEGFPDCRNCTSAENSKPFNNFIKPLVNRRTGGGHVTGYRDYLTARVRLIDFGDDLEDVLNQRLSHPMLLPQAAEDRLSLDLLSRSILPVCNASIHRPGSDYTGGIPPVPENSSELGNMRYLHIPSAGMWKGLDAVEDEATEVARILSHLTVHFHQHLSCDHPDLIRDVRDALCHRVSAIFPQITDDQPLPDTLINVKEAMIFRAWALAVPRNTERTSSTEISIDCRMWSVNYMYPFPDELFWGPEFEGDEIKGHALPSITRETASGEVVPVPWWFRVGAYERLM